MDFEAPCSNPFELSSRSNVSSMGFVNLVAEDVVLNSIFQNTNCKSFLVNFMFLRNLVLGFLGCPIFRKYLMVEITTTCDTIHESD